METDIGLYGYIGGNIDAILDLYVGPAVGRIVTAVSGLFLLLVSVTMALHAVGVWIGTVREPFWDTMLLLLKYWVIGIIVLSAANYTYYVVDSLTSLQTWLIKLMSDVEGGTQYEVLDGLMGKSDDLASWAYDHASIGRFDVQGATVWTGFTFILQICTTLVVGAGGAAMVIANFMLQILFSVGPVYILAAIHPRTAKYMEGWWGQLMNYLFIAVLVSTLMSLAVSLYGGMISQMMLTDDAKVSPWSMLGMICGMTFFLLIAVYMAYSTAAGLAGGLSLSPITLGQMGRNAQPLTNAASKGLKAGGNAAGRGAGAAASYGYNKVMNRGPANSSPPGGFRNR